MPTVYFDTSFYVNLRGLDEPAFPELLRNFDDLDIRLVLSRPLWQELILSKAADGDQQTLYSRIHALRNPTLFLEEDLDWQLLLVPLDDRERYARGQTQIGGAVETTRSVRLLSESGSKEEMDQFVASQQETVKQMGWLKDDGSYNLDKILPLLKETFGVDLSSVASAEFARETDQMLRQRFGSVVVDQNNQIAQLSSATLAKSSRPARHAAGLLSKKAEGQLSRDYRDIEHMNEFISHSDVIDFLQLDSKQLRRVTADSSHPLHSHNLVERCFAADKLLDVIPAIRTLIG